MTSFRNHVAFSCLSIVGTIGLVSFSNPANAAEVDGVRQATVLTADLDLGNSAGQATFERRIGAAARIVCAEQSRDRASAETACRRNAVTQARRDAGLADVSAG
ncbi:UrcA family protein [Sphingomonas sp. 1P08PE]|uniref:UrcA family protein n=1 Tax=Sphingomonas sp. 1P08PE TaxID=554122 RepID=UPI0039A29C13